MFKELIDANKGVEYVFLSNDEAYYTGKAPNEIDSAKSLGGNGKLLAQFISRMADTLKQYGTGRLETERKRKQNPSPGRQR